MTEFLRDLLLNGYNGVKPIETIQKGNNLGQQIKDVASAELAKNGPRVLFYKQLPALYGSDLARISSKGSIDPARTLSIASSRYVDTGKNRPTLGKLIGNLLGGSANRPSDTIFPANEKGQGVASEPPVSINGQPVNQNWDGLKYAVEAGKNYVVSQEPAGKNGLTGLLKGNPSDIARNAIGAATAGAKQAVGRLAVNALTSKRRSSVNSLKEVAAGKKLESKFLPNTYEKPGSKHIKVKNMLGNQELIDVEKLKIKERNYLIDTKLLQERFFDTSALQKLVQENTGNNLQYIQIKVEGKPNNLLFPAAVTDIQDNMTPEWTAFKYVGSPFNNYRYSGVERKINFDFRVYWIGNGQQIVMKDKLNALRQLVYPDSDLTIIELNNSGESKQNTPYRPTVFTPNIIELSIGDLYRNLKGFVSNLSITVPQDTPWATSNPNFLPNNVNTIYPTFVDVSFEMTIIENHKINNDNTITYKFDDAREELQTKPGSSVGKNPGLVFGSNPLRKKPQLPDNPKEDRTDWGLVKSGTRRNQITYDEDGNILTQRNAPVGRVIPYNAQ